MRLILFLGLVLASSLGLQAQDAHGADLTADELAQALDIHWWTIAMPTDLGPKDSVGYVFVSADGKELEGGAEVSRGPVDAPLGAQSKLFCWEDKASGKIRIKFVGAWGAGGSFAKDYFAHAASGGMNNGTLLQPGDILLAFDSSKNPSFTPKTLLPGQIGLKIVIRRK